MKKLLLTLSLMVMTAGAWAVPAKPGLWRTLQLADGTEVKAQLVGDEHLHFYVAEDGTRYMEQDGTYVLAGDEQLKARLQKRQPAATKARRNMMRRVSMGEQTHYTGKKKGIVILMQFTDKKFRTGNDSLLYTRILNEEGFSQGNFKGSVSDYFKAQSNGQFELDFDVCGPYTAKHNMSYYGKNDSNGDDQHPDSLIVEAVKKADAVVDFKDYDWDGDGEVDQVFILYAGKGEADSNETNSIWPHMYELQNTNAALELDGVRINTYACSNEVDASNQIEGIGCFCHEFSHCMGFPDFYDVMSNGYSGNYGLGSWDLMCSGSYNGNTFQPAGYSAYEKWMSGWLEPIELNKEAVNVENLKTTAEGGDAYIIYNDGNRNEYYVVENRQRTGWDASLPGRGLMVMHVDFDKEIWEQNTPNANVSQYYASRYGYKVNDHERCTIIAADNSRSDYTEAYDLFPYGKRDSLTNTSTPKASVFNKNTDGSLLMNKPILKITQNSDRTMSFVFPGNGQQPGDDPGDNPEPQDGVLFYESFDQSNGTGGNDGLFTGNVASSKLVADNEGWDYNKGYGGDKCARFGTASIKAEVTTPSIIIDGETLLTFRAAGWANDGEALTLTLSGDDGVTLSETDLEMVKSQWTDYQLVLDGKGTVKITFTPAKRFFLDEVKVFKSDVSTAIRSVERTATTMRIYTLDGRYMGTDTTVLPHGLYVIGGKKVVK